MIPEVCAADVNNNKKKNLKFHLTIFWEVFVTVHPVFVFELGLDFFKIYLID